jgi:hypothetical protein
MAGRKRRFILKPSSASSLPLALYAQIVHTKLEFSVRENRHKLKGLVNVYKYRNNSGRNPE